MARRLRPELDQDALRVLGDIVLIDLDRSILTAAGTIEPPMMRALDAIHVATALTLGSDLDAVLTYDTRMSEAARSAGLRVEAPA